MAVTARHFLFSWTHVLGRYWGPMPSAQSMLTSSGISVKSEGLAVAVTVPSTSSASSFLLFSLPRPSGSVSSVTEYQSREHSVRNSPQWSSEIDTGVLALHLSPIPVVFQLTFLQKSIDLQAKGFLIAFSAANLPVSTFCRMAESPWARWIRPPQLWSPKMFPHPEIQGVYQIPTNGRSFRIRSQTLRLTK